MSNFQRLWRIVEHHQYDILQFPDGELLVDAFTASAMVKVYQALKSSNQERFRHFLNTDRPMAVKLAHFCMDKVTLRA